MADWLSPCSSARGIVSWGSKDGAEGEIQLWCLERENEYRIFACTTGGEYTEVCKVIDVFTLKRRV